MSYHFNHSSDLLYFPVHLSQIDPRLLAPKQFRHIPSTKQSIESDGIGWTRDKLGIKKLTIRFFSRNFLLSFLCFKMVNICLCREMMQQNELYTHKKNLPLPICLRFWFRINNVIQDIENRKESDENMNSSKDEKKSPKRVEQRCKTLNSMYIRLYSTQDA